MPIAKSTIVFAFLAGVLATLTGVVVWRVVTTPAASHPQVGGAFSDLSIPGIKPDTDRRFTARSAILWDTAAHAIRFEQNAFERVPIASITKLMTAMVAIDYGIPWDNQATIEPREYVQGGQLLLHPGETVSMRDLFTASLLGSANNATLAYIRQMQIPAEDFIENMNRKAIELGLEQTHFVDVTGLDKDNVSTAYEVARLAEYVFKNYPAIAQTTSQKEYVFTVSGSGRIHTIRNTNKLIAEHDMLVTGSKTGYLYEASYCLVVQGAHPEQARIAVILGSPSEYEHFSDIKRLLTLDTH